MGQRPQWFHLEPLLIMTHTFFHPLTHVIRHMISSWPKALLMDLQRVEIPETI